MSFFSKAPVSPTAVTRVKASEYESRTVLCRENGILLYGGNDFDIVLPLPVSESKNGAIRLCRLNDEGQALIMFQSFSNTIPILWKLMKKDAIKELQEICDTVRSMDQRFTVAHLVVVLNKPHLLKDPCIQSFIDSDRCGYTPIMLAIKRNNLSMVQALVSLNCSLGILDSEGKSVIHYAAISTETKILEFLLEKRGSQRYTVHFDKNGNSPLSYAITSGNIKACHLLIDVGERVQTSTIKGVNTQIHDCNNLEVLKLFLFDETIDLNFKDPAGLTPLHSFVKKGNYDCALCLLSYGADSSLYDNDGNSPLHTAVKNLDMEMVVALIVFGANVDHLNSNNHSARHYIDPNKTDANKILSVLHSVSAQRCSPNIQGCTDACSYKGTYNGPVTSINLSPQTSALQHLLSVAAMEKAAQHKQNIRGGRLLCLDGGGIRGLVLIQILKILEAEAKKPIIQYFDWVAGTSTGGIISLALASGKSLKECQILYFKLKDEVFKGDMPYSAETIENLFQKYFGHDVNLSKIEHPKTIITSVLYEKNPFRLHMFRNYPSPEDMLKYSNQNSVPVVEVPIWKVARATSAAPGFFIPFERYIDGGILANNPTLDALTEMLEYKVAKRATENEVVPFATVVVSCGTGLIPTTGILTNLLRSTGNLSSVGILSIAKNILPVLKDLANVIVELITGADGRFVDRARAWCCTAGVPYFRLNPPMSSDISLAETSNKVIIHMMWETMVYMHNNRVLVKEIVDTLSQD